MTRREVEEKALRLAEFSGAATAAEMRDAAARIFGIADAPRVGPLLVAASEARATSDAIRETP